VKSPTPGGPALLLALPPDCARGPWLDHWKIVLDAWPGKWFTLSPDPHYVTSWRRRALEHCPSCWTALPSAGCVPGPLAFSLALKAMAEDSRVACVSIVSNDALVYLPELTPATPPFYQCPIACGGVALVKGPLAAKAALPEPRFYPYDLAEATFRMTLRELKTLVLPDPSFIETRPALSLRDAVRGAYLEGRGAAAFRLFHKGRAPRSLRLPEHRAALLLSGPWLVPATAWRMARRQRAAGLPAGSPVRILGPLLQAAALWAGALRGYSIK
jgi:hypothetical protein